MARATNLAIWRGSKLACRQVGSSAAHSGCAHGQCSSLARQERCRPTPRRACTGPLIALRRAAPSPSGRPRDYAALRPRRLHAERHRLPLPCAWSRRPPPACRCCSTRATRRSPSTRCSICSRGPTRVCSAPDLLEAWYGFLLVSGNAYLEAVAVDGTPARAARAAPRPHEGGARARRLAGGLRLHAPAGSTRALRRRGRRPACARSCTSRCSTRSTTTTA